MFAMTSTKNSVNSCLHNIFTVSKEPSLRSLEFERDIPNDKITATQTSKFLSVDPVVAMVDGKWMPTSPFSLTLLNKSYKNCLADNSTATDRNDSKFGRKLLIFCFVDRTEFWDKLLLIYMMIISMVSSKTQHWQSTLSFCVPIDKLNKSQHIGSLH